MTRNILLSISVLLFSFSAYSQTNLVSSSHGADRKNYEWQALGDAAIEDFGGAKRFVVRNGGSFLQQVMLPEDSAGKYLLIIGNGNSDRGFSNIYAFIWDGDHILDYLHDPNMFGRSEKADEWNCLSGIFPIPEKSQRVSLYLGQTAKKNASAKGSSARFDKLGVFIFDDPTSADQFGAKYCSESK